MVQEVEVMKLRVKKRKKDEWLKAKVIRKKVGETSR